MRRTLLTIALVGLVVFCASAPSSADIVVFSYSGTVTSGVFTGLGFDGTVTYDTLLGADANPADIRIGVYDDSITGSTLFINSVDHSFVADILDEATVKDDFPAPPGVDGLEFMLQGTGGAVDLLLRDDDASVFVSDSLPDTLPALEAFEFQSFDFALFAEGPPIIGGGVITGIGMTVQTVPAPSAMLLGGLGLAIIVTLRRRLT